jgi:hypothetical protein
MMLMVGYLLLSHDEKFNAWMCTQIRCGTVPLYSATSSAQGNTQQEDCAISLLSNSAREPFARSSINDSHRPADSYHTLYCLAGLSTAQHNIFLSSTRRDLFLRCEGPHGRPCTRGVEVSSSFVPESSQEQLRQACFSQSLSWTEEEGTSHVLGSQNNRMVLFNVVPP